MSEPSRERIDRLAEEFVERYRRGEWPQISEYIERHPELADSILQVFPPLIALERAAQAGPSERCPDRLGPYRIVERIGAGGQGEVFLAEDTRLSRRVALKVLNRDADPTGQLLARFRREAAVTARLDHPGICTVYEAGEERGTAYIAMRLVDGETLAAWVARAAEPGESSSATREGVIRILQIGEAVARALHVAHEANLIHRDIKPGNIMLTQEGDPVVLDFGLARDIADDQPALTRTGMMMGTPIYMSPEQINLEQLRIDHRTDVYSLGVTIYECLTLKRPFDGATWDQLYNQILTAEPEDPRRLNPVIPRDLRVVLATAMEKDRDRRYQTALDFAEDLRRVRELEPILAKPAGPVLRLRRWAQRNALVAAIAAALFLALAVGLAVSWHLLGETQDALDEVSSAHDAKSKALTRAAGLSLAAQSLALVQKDPGLALSLALEAEARAPGAQANDALLRALERNRERFRFDREYVGQNPALEFSRDGSHLAVGGMPEFLAIGEGETTGVVHITARGQSTWFLTGSAPGQTLLTSPEKEHLPFTEHVALGRDERIAAVFSIIISERLRGVLDLWDLEKKRRIERIPGIFGGAFGPDGKELLLWGYRESRLWPSGETRPLETPKDAYILTGFWEGSAPRLVVSRKESEGAWAIEIRDARGGELLNTLRGHTAEIVHGWTVTGTLLTCARDRTLRLWNPAGGEEASFDLGKIYGDDFLHGLGSPFGLRAAFSPDGATALLYHTNQNHAQLLDVRHRRFFGSLVGHEGGIRRAAFSPDGKLVGTVSVDETARVWDARQEVPVVALRGDGGMVSSVAFDPRGERVVTVPDYGQAQVWDARTGRSLATIDTGEGDDPARLRFLDEKLLFGTYDVDDDVRLATWNAGTGKRMPLPEAVSARCSALDVHIGRRLVALAGAQDIRILEIDSGKLFSRIESGGAAEVEFSPDGERLIENADPVNVWDVATGRLVAQLPHPGGADTVRVTPDGSVALTAAGESLDSRLWSLPSGKLLATLPGHRDGALSMSIGPDGRFAATVDYSGLVRVCDLVAARALYSLDVDRLNLVRIDPHGKRMLTVAHDGFSQLWDVASGGLVVRYHKPAGRDFQGIWYTTADMLADFSPSGDRVVTAAWNGIVRIYPVYPVAAARAWKPRRLTDSEREQYLDPLKED